MRNVVVLADSLAFYGPDGPLRPSDERLWPNVMAAHLNEPVNVDVVARLGWTARDAWWSVTKDPNVWGELIPNADLLIIAVGGMDHLPASIPTFLRDGIPYIRPGRVRRIARKAYRKVSPYAIRLTRARLRQLPQQATDHYLHRIVTAVRHWHPGVPVVLQAPAPFSTPDYPIDTEHPKAVDAAREWGTANDALVLDVDDYVAPSLADGSANPDGIHWSWETHRLIGEATAGLIADQVWRTPRSRARAKRA